MKKIIIITLIAFTAQMANAQNTDDGKDIKNVRFGLQVLPSINWYKPDGNIMAKNGVAPKIGGGVIIEFRLAKVASIQTGINIEEDGGKVQYKGNGIKSNNTNTVSYYASNADQTVDDYNSRPSDVGGATSFDLNNTKYQLNEREFKATYIVIPFCLKLKTKQIGAMTYFGQVGVNTCMRWKAKATDNVTELQTTASAGGSSDTRSSVVVTKEMNLFSESLYLGAGCEMSLSGSTSLLLGLHYNLGFTSATKKSSPTLEKQTNGPKFTDPTTYVNGQPTDYTQEEMPQSIKTNAIVLTVGILF